MRRGAIQKSINIRRHQVAGRPCIGQLYPGCWLSLYRPIISPPFLVDCKNVRSGLYCRLKCFAQLCFGPFEPGHFPVACLINPIICHKLLLPPPCCSFKPCDTSDGENTPGCVQNDARYNPRHFVAPCPLGECLDIFHRRLMLR